MAITIGSDYLLAQQTQNSSSTAKAGQLSSTLNSIADGAATDEELMEACKSFETYLVEQVIKQAKETLLNNEDDEGDYMKYFGDNLNEEYAKLISENSNLGIAQMLYDATKRNQS